MMLIIVRAINTELVIENYEMSKLVITEFIIQNELTIWMGQIFFGQQNEDSGQLNCYASGPADQLTRHWQTRLSEKTRREADRGLGFWTCRLADLQIADKNNCPPPDNFNLLAYRKHIEQSMYFVHLLRLALFKTKGTGKETCVHIHVYTYAICL